MPRSGQLYTQESTYTIFLKFSLADINTHIQTLTLDKTLRKVNYSKQIISFHLC